MPDQGILQGKEGPMKTPPVQSPVSSPPASGRLQDAPPWAAQVPPAAPRRGLDVPCSTAWSLLPWLSEEALLEQVRQCCFAEGRRHFLQVEVRSCQELTPEAVSLVQPPERCWLVRLTASEQTGVWIEEEVQAIVSLTAGTLHLLFR